MAPGLINNTGNNGIYPGLQQRDTDGKRDGVLPEKREKWK